MKGTLMFTCSNALHSCCNTASCNMPMCKQALRTFNVCKIFKGFHHLKVVVYPSYNDIHDFFLSEISSQRSRH